MPAPPSEHGTRTIGMAGATYIGVGAIVGGGILVLAGTAFAATGPGAILAFALNGLIALITAASFAELGTAFPESGGPYAFAKRLVSVRAAFAVGWILWFAYIVAAVRSAGAKKNGRLRDWHPISLGAAVLRVEGTADPAVSLAPCAVARS